MDLRITVIDKYLQGWNDISFMVCFERCRYDEIVWISSMWWNLKSCKIFDLGSDEGVYAWVVANYALGTLGGDPQETTGIIELGGASAQVFILLPFVNLCCFFKESFRCYNISRKNIPLVRNPNKAHNADCVVVLCYCWVIFVELKVLIAFCLVYHLLLLQ